MRTALTLLLSFMVACHFAVGCCASISHASDHEPTGHSHCHADTDTAHHHHDHGHNQGDEESAPVVPQESSCAALGCAAVLTGKLAVPNHDGLAASVMLYVPTTTTLVAWREGSLSPDWSDGRETAVPLFLACQRLLL